MMGLAAVSFAGTPNDSKTTNENSAETKAGSTYFWYKVSYVGDPNGYIPANAEPLIEGSQEDGENEADCDLGTTRDCLRGFANELTGPSSLPGDAQVKTDEQP